MLLLTFLVKNFCVFCFISQNEWLKQRQEGRSASWAAFVDEMCEKCNTVDTEFASEVRRVEDYYRDIEQKMMKDNVSS